MEGEYSGNCNFEGSTSKRNKIDDGRGNLLQITSDRISDLPESLLIHILSCLVTKDAIKTCILSKRWKNVWTHVENLVFEYDESDEPSVEDVKKFISFIDHALLHCTRTNLKRFSIFSDCDDFGSDDCSLVDKWLQFVLEKNVKCFELLIYSLSYCAPEWFYHNLSLVDLKISSWEIKILGKAVSWPSLKILKLVNVKIDDEEIAKILLGCPVLEDLSLHQVRSITHLNILSPSVRKLDLYQIGGYGDLLDLNAPWLQELEIYGDFESVIPRFINVSSLITAKIEIDHFVQNFRNNEDLLLNTACQLLDTIHHVKELTLTYLFVQAFSIQNRLGRPLPLFMCKHLTVHLSTLQYDLPWIAYLLQSSPNLENLAIEFDSISYVYFQNIFAELHEMNISSIPPRGDSMHLKNVKLIFFEDLCYREILQCNQEMFPEIALADYLFKDAPFMEKLVISTETKNCQNCKTNCASYYLSLLSSTFFGVCAEKEDSLEWHVRKKCSTLEISHT